MPSARKREGRSTGLFIAGALVVAGVVGGGVLLALQHRTRSGSTSETLVTEFVTEEGSSFLRVRVPDAPAGATLRLESSEAPITNGIARFPAALLGERVGKLDLPAIVRVNGADAPRTVHIVVGYAVRPELEALGQDPPVARLRVRVEPGARLAVDGQPATLDAQSTAVVTVSGVRPLSASEPRANLSVSLRVTASDGTVTEGSYRLELPRAPLALERPTGGALLTTAQRAAIVVRAPGAGAVLIHGSPATREGELFSSAVAVQASGPSQVEVRVLRPRFAPALETVTIERLPSGREGLARLSPTQGAPCGAPTVGQVFSLVGRVVSAPRTYNGGVSFRIEARDRRCPGRSTTVWIDAEPDASARERQTVRVVGRYTGTRTALTSTGERRTDPVVHAAVLGR